MCVNLIVNELNAICLLLCPSLIMTFTGSHNLFSNILFNFAEMALNEMLTIFASLLFSWHLKLCPPKFVVLGPVWFVIFPFPS